jgi:hypothetical protein
MRVEDRFHRRGQSGTGVPHSISASASRSGPTRFIVLLSIAKWSEKFIVLILCSPLQLFSPGRSRAAFGRTNSSWLFKWNQGSFASPRVVRSGLDLTSSFFVADPLKSGTPCGGEGGTALPLRILADGFPKPTKHLNPFLTFPCFPCRFLQDFSS